MSNYFKRHPQLSANLAYQSIRLLGSTWTFEEYYDDEYDPYQPSLFCFWHGQQIIPMLKLYTHHYTPKTTLVSPSQDGSILTLCLHKFGYQVLRGSSMENNVGGLRALIRSLQQGASIGFGVDGPRGPIHQVKPGMPYLSRRFNIPLVAVGSAASRTPWQFKKSWDRFEIPPPFSRIGYVISKPFLLSGHLSDTQCIAQAIWNANQKAQALLA